MQPFYAINESSELMIKDETSNYTQFRRSKINRIPILYFRIQIRYSLVRKKLNRNEESVTITSTL